MSKFKNLTPEQKAALEAAKAQLEEQQQQNDAIFKEAMQASSQIQQYNQDVSNYVDNVSKEIKLAGKASKGGCEII